MAKSKPSRPGDASQESFADAIESMGDVEPLDRTNLSDLPDRPDTHGASRTPDGRAAAATPSPSRRTAPDTVERVRATRKELRRLRAGKIRPELTVDLHGLTRDEAFARLCNAIAGAAAAGNRCVLVIHGRGHHTADGRSVLKDSLADWIVRPPLANRVMEYCVAQSRDGGVGASYLLLRDQP